MSNSDGSGSAFTFFLSLYMISVGVAAVYFNWEFARNNGFARWIMLGEVVSTAKATVWPYFAIAQHHRASSARTTEELKSASLSSQQITDGEVKKFILSINYSQQGAYLLNVTPHERLEDYPNLRQILAYREKAVEVGKSVDKDVLNSVYAGLGDKFEDDFLKAMSLFVHGAEAHSVEELNQSEVLNNEWADWYQPRRKAIEDAVNVAMGRQ